MEEPLICMRCHLQGWGAMGGNSPPSPVVGKQGHGPTVTVAVREATREGWGRGGEDDARVTALPHACGTAAGTPHCCVEAAFQLRPSISDFQPTGDVSSVLSVTSTDRVHILAKTSPHPF